MKSLLKSGLFSILNIFFRTVSGGSILMYHSIGENQAFFTVKTSDFERQLQYLKDHAYTVVTLTQFVELLKNMQKSAGKSGTDLSKVVALTFDDGYADNYASVFSLLKKYSFPATIFIATDFIGKSMTNSEGIELPMLSVEQITEMSWQGIEFMPHTKTHRELPGLAQDALHDEIEGSRTDIKNLTGKPASIFAYPRGKYDAAAIDYLKNHSWDAAVTVKAGLIKVGDSIFELKRNAVDSATSFPEFKAKLTDAIDVYAKLRLNT